MLDAVFAKESKSFHYGVTVKPWFTDNCLIRTPHYHGQFALSTGKESPYISLNSETD